MVYPVILSLHLTLPWVRRDLEFSICFEYNFTVHRFKIHRLPIPILKFIQWHNLDVLIVISLFLFLIVCEV